MASTRRQKERAGNDPTQEAYYGNNLSSKDRLNLASARQQKQIEDFASKTPEDAKVQEDPAMRAAQLDALKRYEGFVSNRGMDAESKAKMHNAELAAAGQLGANQASLRDRLARTGRDIGGGASLAMANQNIVNAANQQADAGYQVAADAENRYLDSVSRMAGLGGAVRGQDYGIASDKAKAQDAYNQMVMQLKMQGYDDERAAAMAQQELVKGYMGLGGNVVGGIIKAIATA